MTERSGPGQEVLVPSELQSRLNGVIERLYNPAVDESGLSNRPIDDMMEFIYLLGSSNIPETFKDVFADQAQYSPGVNDLFEDYGARPYIKNFDRYIRRDGDGIFGEEATGIAVDFLNAYKNCSYKNVNTELRMRFEIETYYGKTVNKLPDGFYVVVD